MKRVEFRLPLPVKYEAEIADLRWDYGTQETEEHQAQWEDSRRNPGSARALFPRQGGRGAGRPDRSGALPRGPERGKPERSNPSQRKPGRDGPPRGQAAGRGPLRGKPAKSRSAQYGFDRSGPFRRGPFHHSAAARLFGAASGEKKRLKHDLPPCG